MLKRATLVAAAGAAIVASGCAEEREPLSWVQPDALDKSFFVGKDLQDPSDDPEFYTQGTLIDVGYGASQDGLFTSTYAQQTSRIKWVIEQDQLVARLTYERINGSDGKGVGKLKDQGQVVAAFRIQSHFDIQKQYNPSTGEEMNVVVENTTDRPWNERQFMRVDWSENLAVDTYDFDTLASAGLFGGVKYESLAYYVNDPRDPDAPHFDVKGGYFDVTNKAWATPKEIDLRHLGWGIDSFPACMLPADFLGGTAPIGNCNPVELTVRHSFRRIENTDYQPVDWDGLRFRAFGAFTQERQGYTRKFGTTTDDQWHRFIARYNLWERSHFYTDPEHMTGEIVCAASADEDANLDRDGDGTADQCAGVTTATGIAGSQCDVFNQKCTLPFRARKVKPIAWYYTNGSNLEYFEPTEWATHEWDVALRSAAQTARYVECVSTGGADCSTQFPVIQGQEDDNSDAVWLAREVDSCRLGHAYVGQDCNKVADDLGAERKMKAGVIALAKLDEALVLCHSPVEAGDPAACAPADKRLPKNLTAAACADARDNRDESTMAVCEKAVNARIGDLRYHQVNVITSPQTPSPWGIMVDAEDPLTGEKVSASINVWSHVSDMASESLVDTSRYIKGELKTEDITEGTYVRNWPEAVAAAGQNGSVGHFSKAELEKKVADFAGIDLQKFQQIKASPIANDPSLKAEIRAFDQQLRTEILADARATTTNAPMYEARRARAVGSALEAKLTNLQMQELGGAASSRLSTEMKMALSSPLRGNNPVIARELRQMRELALADRGACVLDASQAPAPVSTANVADLLEKKFAPQYGPFNANDDKSKQLARAEAMRKYVARKFHYAVIAHEMGHSVGLRHNFVSSADAWGYRPQYWQLRTKNGTQTEICQDYDATGNCVGPRYFDPITTEERENLIQMFMHSTVMDYPGELTQDMIGLGAYDFAAARMFYADAMPVHADASYNVGQPRGTGMIELADNFGGITGIQVNIGADNDPTQSTSLHYSQLQNAFQLIQQCEDVDATKFRPATWNEQVDGPWDPLFDGLIVNVGGSYSRCRQQPVDYVKYDDLRPATSREAGYNRGGPVIDSKNRTRVPYGFATDNWADTGNLSVFRHDNGADAYELFDFFITSQEINHVFDNYRRGRSSFSVKGAAYRTLERYNEKMRDAAKGLGLMANIYKDFALELGVDYNTLWPVIVNENYPLNMIASTLAFDQFTKQLQRPEIGPHFLPTRGLSAIGSTPAEDGVLRSDHDTIKAPGRTLVVVPNGATGYFGNVAAGGKMVENTYADDTQQGDYYSDYIVNAGSYYDKVFSPMLMTESADNFVSNSRRDFVDPRYRAVSLADLFPDGFRRWLANNLTGDDQIKGVRVAADSSGKPVLENNKDKYPAQGIGFTSWAPKEGPETCFKQPGTLLCSTDPVNTVVLDPQVGWEQQKFLIASTLQYIPENQKQFWLNRMWVWELGTDSDPGFANRIEFHDPMGRVYVAKTFGKEMVYGKLVQKGISARVLEWANSLLKDAYVTDDGPDLDGDGTPDWYIPRMGTDGQPMVKFDSRVVQIDGDFNQTTGRDGCNATDSSQCTCEENIACTDLERYSEVPFFLREAIGTYGLGAPGMRGIF